jgi:hypothetical protein
VEQQEKALTGLNKSNTPVTAKSVKKALTPEEQAKKDIEESAAGDTKPPPPKLEFDEQGVPITPEALPFWHRKKEVQELLTAVSRVKSKLQAYSDDNDRMMGWLLNHAKTGLEAAYTAITNAMPYAVCTKCQGHPNASKCAFCHGTGLISKYKYTVQTDRETREMREKRYAVRSA